MKKTKNFIAKAIKKPGRVRAIVYEIFGSKAFTQDERNIIKPEYLDKALELAEQTGDTSLVRAIKLAQRLKGIRPLDPIASVDLPKPDDYEVRPDAVLVRFVPGIDNLVEIGLYLPADQWDRLNAVVKQLGIRTEKVQSGYLARRGRTEKATNVFFIRNS